MYNYNYEEGDFATIRISWDDVHQRLIIHERDGNYARIPVSDEFRLIIAGGFDSTEPESTITVYYDGQETIIDL